MDSPIVRVSDLALHKKSPRLTFDCGSGLTLIVADRESGASTLSLALAGRYSPAAGTIEVGKAASTRQRFRSVALAGAPLIDSLERPVTVRETIREQVAWAQPFYRRVPRDILAHRYVAPWLGPLGLAGLDTAAAVGDTDPGTRLRLRTLLALVSRPAATLLVVDDPDQLRSTRLREEFLADLKELSAHLPVVATTVNPDGTALADAVVDLTGEVAA